MSNIEYKIAKKNEDFEGIKDLCLRVFGEGERDMISDLFYSSPSKEENICFYAYDKEKKRYVGTINLLEMPIRYGDITLKAAEYGIVATDEEYRGRGINKKLNDLFFNTAEELGYNILAIEGIPYFYRRYGFNYAVPMGGVNLKLDKVEAKSDVKVSLREVKEEDIQFIAKDFKEASNRAHLCTVKGENLIKAQALDYISSEMKKRYLIIEEDGDRIGYCALNCEDNLQICDISDNLPFEIYEGVIKHFKEEGKEEVGVNIPKDSKFINFLKRYDAKWNKWYSWQLRIGDEFKFLKDIRPVLEERLSKSIYKDEKVEFYYDNFREWIKFEIDNGKINLTKEKREEAKWDFNLSPQGAIKLFLGEKSMEEINSFLPDCQANKEYIDLINILFPKMESHFYMAY